MHIFSWHTMLLLATLYVWHVLVYSFEVSSSLGNYVVSLWHFMFYFSTNFVDIFLFFGLEIMLISLTFSWFYQDLLSESLLKSMYVSFLAGCFRSVRFGFEEAHGCAASYTFFWLVYYCDLTSNLTAYDQKRTSLAVQLVLWERSLCFA